ELIREGDVAATEVRSALFTEDPENGQRPGPVAHRDIERMVDPVALEEVLVRRASDVVGPGLDERADRPAIAKQVPERRGIVATRGELISCAREELVAELVEELAVVLPRSAPLVDTDHREAERR